MKIPFFPNTGDGTHCFQAAMMMALAVCMPQRRFPMRSSIASRASVRASGPGRTTAMLWMREQGLLIRLIEDFDYLAFAERGGAYLIERFGEEVGKAQMANSDVEPEREIARRFAALAPIERRSPNLEDIRSELASGAVVIVNLNAAPLLDAPGYSGHFVVVCEVTERTVRLHDPGLPPRPDLKVSIDRFLAAWAYPTERDQNLLSIRALNVV